MKNIYSQTNDGLVLCSIYSAGTARRENLSHEDEPLQVSVLQLEAGCKVDSHSHLFVHRETSKTQECWVVMRGSLHVKIYDLDDLCIDDFVLSAGEVLVTFNGGHGFETLNDTELVEIKNGPYFGPAQDYRKLNAQN